MDFILGALFFLLTSSRASHEMPRLHRLAHKAPVMQASVQCACTARQKHDSALYANRQACRDESVVFFILHFQYLYIG